MKILITGGCSFSECKSPWVSTWPNQLSEFLTGYQHISTGMGSQGNGLISRRIIYQVTETLKTHSSDDILVGIMWSGPDRHDFYLQNLPVVLKEDFTENPTKFVPESAGGWKIPSAEVPPNPNYYRYFHDTIGQYIYTYEHMLRTQWFLKLHNVKYFMTTYTKEVFQQTKHIDVKHLYDQIDLELFLPIIGEYEWCRDHSELEFPIKGDNHPGSDQHKKFTEQVILPFLKKKQYI
jgi:hypothetical protein